MVILVLAAQGLEVGCIVPLAGVWLLGHHRKGPPDRDLIKGTQLETVYPTSIPKVLKHLPGDHRALPARIGGDDDPLHALKCLLDRIHLGLVRLTGAAGAIGNRDTLEHDRQRIKPPRLPFLPNIAGFLGSQEMALGGDADCAR
jgi:hypothetical protein